MNGLIETLKKEHVAIEDLLTRVRDTSITNKEAHGILIAAHEGLLAHLRKEDRELYPVLHHIALYDVELKKTMDYYAQDMIEITRKAEAFFAKYAPEDAPIDIQFAKELGLLFSTISRRMRSEEGTLYEVYSKNIAKLR